MKCQSCGFDNPATSKFCGACGSPFAQPIARCSHCSAENPAGFKFCGSCGAALEKGEPAPADRPDRAERRQLTVLFCDIVGSTKLSEELELEELRRVIREYQAASVDVVEEFGGHVAQYLGDGILVYFGYPTAHEDDARRAVHSGLGIVRAVEQLNQQSRDEDVDLAVRIGIHTGPVVAGEIGAGKTRERLALGQTPNVAARLQGEAEPNTIVLSQAAYRLIHGFFKCEELGAKTLSGVSEPMTVYRVLRESGVTSSFEVAVSQGLTPLAGRQRDLETLIGLFERVKQGQGQTVMLAGEAGMGKSRLVQMLLDHTASETRHCFVCRCSPYHQQSALSPVIDLLRDRFRFTRDESAAEQVRKLEEGLRSYDLPLPEVVPLLADLLAVPLNGRYAALNLSPQRQKQKTLETLLALMFKMSSEQLVVLSVEDLHWSDPSTLEFLSLLIAQAPTARVLTLLTFRPAFEPPWGLPSNVAQMTIDRLSNEQVEAMVSAITGGRSLPPEVTAHIVQKTDGVPLFVEELTKMLLESDLLRANGNGYELVGPLEQLAIPTTLHDSLAARLDRMETAREVAQLGSVLGREFNYEMLSEVSALDAERLQAELNRLVKAEILHQQGLPPRATFIFKHALIQDAAYDSLLKATRRDFHRRAGTALAEKFPDDAERRPEVLAYHFSEARMPELAVPSWLQAGRLAISRFANAEAIGHLSRGLDQVESLPDSPQRSGLELALQTSIGSAFIATRGYGATEVHEAFARAIELCERMGDTPELYRALLGLWMFKVVRADFEAGLGLGRRLLRLAEPTNDGKLLAEAHYSIGFTHFYIGQHAEAREHLERALAHDHAESYGSVTGDDIRIHIISLLALTLWHLGYPDQAQQRAHQSIELAREEEHPHGVAFSLTIAGWVHRLCGQSAEVAPLVREAQTVAQDKGYFYWQHTAGFLIALVQTIDPNLDASVEIDDAVAGMRQSVGALQMAGANLGRTLMLTQLADTLLSRGLLDEARDALEACKKPASAQELAWDAEVHRLSGELAVRTAAVQPDDETTLLEQAERSFERAIAVARQQEAKSLELRAALDLARLLNQRGEQAHARELVTDLHDSFSEGLETPALVDAKVMLETLSRVRSS